MTKRTNARRGAVLMEFAIVGVVVLCAWLCLFQMGIGAWRYHTLQYAVKMCSAYMSLHGTYCASGGNTCSITIENAAQVLQNAAVGIPASQITVTFTPYIVATNTAAGGSYPVTCTLNNCLTNTTAYPPTGYGVPGTCDIRITASYTFQSLMVMVIPYVGSTQFGTYTFTSDTRQPVLF